MAAPYDEKGYFNGHNTYEPGGMMVTEAYHSDAYPNAIERHWEDQDHELASTREGDHGTKRALVSDLSLVCRWALTGLAPSSGIHDCYCW